MIQIDIPMPKNCDDCPFYDLNMGTCDITVKDVSDHWDNLTKPDDCPLVESPVSHLTDRPCNVCKHHTENGCERFECVFKGV